MRVNTTTLSGRCSAVILTYRMILALIVCASFMPESSYAQTDGGAFGIKIGQPISSLTIVAEPYPNWYQVRVPDPNPNFENYFVSATPRLGVCGIEGMGFQHLSDEYGKATQAAFSAVRAALNSRYGPSIDYDYLHNGASATSPNEWVKSIFQKQRTFESYWNKESGANLPPVVTSIKLDVLALSNNFSFVVIVYRSNNFEKCRGKGGGNSDGL